MNSNAQLIDFYKKCELEGLSVLNDTYSEKKAEQIAKVMNVDLTEGIQTVFSYAKQKAIIQRDEEIKAEKDRKRQEKITYAELADPYDYETLSKYSDLYGNEKLIKMTTDINNSEIDRLKNEYESLKNQAKASHAAADFVLRQASLNKEKEKDWAVAGGIAQGIAGGAAGLAAALDAQTQNIEIRARNAANQQAAEQQSVLLGSHGYALDRKAHDALDKVNAADTTANQKIRQLQLKIIGDEDDETVFKTLEIDNINYEISPIGSVRVNCCVSLNSDCFIYGDRPAFVDGSLLAKIFQDDELIGIADMVFPVEGLQKNTIFIEGISLCKADEAKPCVIKLMPKNLWKMEM